MSYRTAYLRRYRHRRSGDPRVLMATLGIGVALAMSGGAAVVVHHHHHHGAVSIPSASGAIAWSRPAWARAFLRGIPEPVTTCNLNAVIAWEVAEGGGFGNQASYDPLNLNPPAGTPWPGKPAIGAWAFPDAPTGLAYSVRTVRNYGGILAALHAAHDAQAVCNAIMASPWATSHYHGHLGASC